MDPHRFDGLVRSLVQPASRRRSLSMLVGGALAALGAGRLGLAPDVAAGKTSGKPPAKAASGKTSGKSFAKAHDKTRGKGHDKAAGQTGGNPPATASGPGPGAP